MNLKNTFILGLVGTLVSCGGAVPAPASLPEGVREMHDIRYTTPDDPEEKHRLNVFIPRGEGPFPVLFFVHGGAWRFGDRDTRFHTYANIGRYFAGRGFLTVVPSYRLAPEHQHPAHVQDVAQAIAWTHEHIAEHGGEPARLFLMGHSAGAHLVALVATDPQWLGAHGLSPSSLRGVVPISGPYDLRRVRDEGGMYADRVVEEAFGDNAETFRTASPISHLEDGPLPPFLLIVAEGDPDGLHGQADGFARALENAGARFERYLAEDRAHFSIVMKLGEPGDPVADRAIAFMTRL